MTKNITLLQNFPRNFVTDVELELLLGGSTHSRQSKIKRMIAKGELLHIRRGLYCLTSKLGFSQIPHSFELAQFIYGPSYISLESALSYHKLIPEAVYTVASACTKRSKSFKTPLGNFDFVHLPCVNFFTHVQRIVENNHVFFMAEPWKAICDFVYCNKKDWKNKEPLIESLRIDEDDLPILTDKDLEELIDYYQQKRIEKFLKGVFGK